MLIEDVLTEFKRTHLEHIEDIIITDGFEGGKAVVEYFRGLLLTLKGTSSEAIQVSVKWDGAPAVVCGVNPDNDKFFVGTKSVFAKLNGGASLAAFAKLNLKIVIIVVNNKNK